MLFVEVVGCVYALVFIVTGLFDCCFGFGMFELCGCSRLGVLGMGDVCLCGCF